MNINPEHYQLFQFAQDDKTIGFALFHLVPGDDVAHLLKILIVPEMRGEGFSPHLWTSTLQDLKNSGASSVYLEVAASNHRAIGFYEKCGFKQLRKSKAFYSDGEDALIMSMAL
jgi:ribosomal-protein-alanine N-acetyltransferase